MLAAGRVPRDAFESSPPGGGARRASARSFGCAGSSSVLGWSNPNRGLNCRRESPRTGPGGKPQESVSGLRTRQPRMSGKALERRVIVPSGVMAGSAGRKESGSRLYGVRVELWRGATKPRRASTRLDFGPGGHGSSRGATPWSCGVSWPSGPQSRRARCQKQQEGNGVERRADPRRGKALKGEPHEWHRSLRPEGDGGSKPSGA